MCLGSMVYGGGGGVRPWVHGICNRRPQAFFSFLFFGVEGSWRTLFFWTIFPIMFLIFLNKHQVLQFMLQGGALFLFETVLQFINFTFFMYFFSRSLVNLSLNIPVWCSLFLLIWFWWGFISFSVTNLFFSIFIILL